MKKRTLNSTIFKTLPYLILILVLVISSCGTKHSIKKVCNVENNSSKTHKATTSCQFVQLASNKIRQEILQKKVKFHQANFAIISVNYFEESDSNSFTKATSIPLYILYKQLRSDLI